MIDNDRMTVDVTGRLRNTSLPISHALMPLFDAVMNSIQSIEESLRSKEGLIRIKILRDESESLKLESEQDLRAVKGFIVTDNGCGFNEVNYQSFLTSDSSYKKSAGGKGVGRFLWLKAFAKVEVDSVFNEGGKYFRRRFIFEPTPKGIKDPQLDEIFDSKPETSVTLLGFKSEYRDRISPNIEIIAQKIIEHTLSFFVTRSAPRIEIFDGKTHLNLHEIFDDFLAENAVTIDFQVKGVLLRLDHLKLYGKKDIGNKIHFCAHNRVVMSRALEKFIPDVVPSIKDENGRSFYSCSYLTGKYLDEQVNQERTSFHFQTFDYEDNALFLPELQESDLMNGVSEQIRSILEGYLAPVKAAKKTRVDSFVKTQAPEFKPLLKHFPEVVDKLPASLQDGELRLALYEAHYQKDLDLKKKSQEILSSSDESEEYKESLREFLDKENDFGKATLVNYVAHRKVILNLLEKSIRRNDGRHGLEEGVHQIIFPMQATSTDFASEHQNLWIIDERLTYHKYLASDKRMDKIDELQSKSKKRPDIVVFNNPSAFSETAAGMSSIVLIEFKKPGRDDYSNEDNPVVQIYDYIKLIRAGKAVDNRGLSVAAGDHVSFYCYILCDITPKLRDIVGDLAFFTESQDKGGFFGYHKHHNAYIEIVSYRKMLDDAEKRNRVLFERLNIL
jgi:hypothetical protein